jgi:hypothetical protein
VVLPIHRAAIHGFAQKNRIVQFNLQGGADSHRKGHRYTQTAAGDILHLGDPAHFDISEYGEVDGSFQNQAGIVTLFHTQRIGGRVGNDRSYCQR